MEARYLYCIVSMKQRTEFNEVGIEGNEVYSIPYKDIALLVHRCSPKPYQSQDRKKVEEWLFTHNYIMDEAMKRYGAIIPFSFDVIIKGGDEKVQEWLSGVYPTAIEQLGKFRNKFEYGVQVFLEPNGLKKQIEEENEDIKRLKERIKSGPRGMAFMFGKKVEKLVKDELDLRLMSLKKGFLNELKKEVEWVKLINSKRVPKEYENKKLVLNLACLIKREKEKKLFNILEKLKERGFLIRLTGPWAPFSFVTPLDNDSKSR